jgi:hypothetical protein
MTIIEEFQEQIKVGNIVEAMNLALNSVTELKITTWVSSANAEYPPLDSNNQPYSGFCMRTRMNLIDGYIDNEMGSQFVDDGPYKELQAFHLQQVQQGRKIILSNVESLQQMFVILTNTLSRLP